MTLELMDGYWLADMQGPLRRILVEEHTRAEAKRMALAQYHQQFLQKMAEEAVYEH